MSFLRNLGGVVWRGLLRKERVEGARWMRNCAAIWTPAVNEKMRRGMSREERSDAGPRAIEMGGAERRERTGPPGG